MSKLRATAEVCKDITRLQFSHHLRIEVPFLSSGSLCLSNHLYSTLFLNSPFLHVLPIQKLSPLRFPLTGCKQNLPATKALLHVVHIQVPLTENHNHLKSQAAAPHWQEARESHLPPMEPACSIPSQMVRLCLYTQAQESHQSQMNCAAASNGIVFSNCLYKNSCFMCYSLILWHCLDPFPCVYIWFNLMDFSSFVPFWGWNIELSTYCQDKY